MLVFSDLNPALRTVVENELSTGERVVWSGSPRPRRLAAMKMPAFLFAIPWTVFAILWTFGAAGMSAKEYGHVDWIFALWGVPFILVGLGLLSSPLWALRRAGRTLYLITDRRAVIFDGGRSITVRSFEPDRLRNLQRRQRPDGSGDIIVERKMHFDSDGDRSSTEIGFFGIQKVKDVEDLLRRLVANAADGLLDPIPV